MGYAAGPRAPEPRSGLAPWRRRSDDARLVPEDVAAGSQDGGLPSDPRRPQQPPSDGYPVLGPGTMRVGAQAEAGQSRISPGQTTGTGHRSRPRGCRPAGGGPQPPRHLELNSATGPPTWPELRHVSANLAHTPGGLRVWESPGRSNNAAARADPARRPSRSGRNPGPGCGRNLRRYPSGGSKIVDRAAPQGGGAGVAPADRPLVPIWASRDISALPRDRGAGRPVRPHWSRARRRCGIARS